MVLLVDVGNTRLKWACWENQLMQSVTAYSYQQESLADYLQTSWSQLARPDRVLVACVASSTIKQCLQQWATKHWQHSVEFLVSPAQGQGVTNAYVVPHTLGCDRWAALVGAHHMTEGGACVIDCGSAVTVDVITQSGQHLGGLITPGLAMMHRSLLAGAEGINAGVKEQDDNHATEENALSQLVLGKSTTMGLQHGSLHALVGFIERAIVTAERELGHTLSSIITGGDASTVLPLLSKSMRHEPDLVLHGLAHIAQSQVSEGTTS